ncbi:MAG: transglycosylase domain-containing protein [Synechococcus lacustris]
MPPSPPLTSAPPQPSRRRKQLLLAALVAAGAGTVAATGSSALIQSFDGTLPDARRISTFSRPGTVTVLSADGQVLQKLGPATREKVANGQMPLLVQRAFIAAEDRRFYQHNGVDAVGIGRAVITNLTRGSVEQGASTITQQLARVVFLTQDRTLLRKLKEAALALKLERQLSKQQILEQYLNYVYLGSSAYGVADASWVYFSKSPDQLSLPEAALIAGLPPAPSVYSPLVNPQLALERRAVVLRRMREVGFIDDAQLERANAAPLDLKPALPKHWNSAAPYFTSFVAQELPKVLTPEQLEVGGLTIRSSLNLSWQNQAQKVINANTYGDLEGALVSLEPGTGLVRAMVGGRDFQKSQFNRATQALRSPGSTFKLFTYTAAVAAGIKPEEIFVDAPQCFGSYCPKNFGDRYLGAVSMADALQNSLNTVVVQLLRKVGFDQVINTARSLGITRPLGRFYPLAIGAYEQTVLDMTAAYAAIANRGVYVSPTPFETITGPEGNLLWSRSSAGDRGRRAVDSDTADTMLWMLQRVVSGGTGGAAALTDRPVAGKTGTSEGARDLWFIGTIPQLTTGIWFGYDNNRETGGSSSQAAWAWNQFMTPVVKDMPVKQFPPKPVLHRTFKPPATNSGGWAGNGNANGTGNNAAPPAPWSDPNAKPWQPDGGGSGEPVPGPSAGPAPAAPAPAPAAPLAPPPPAPVADPPPAE